MILPLLLQLAVAQPRLEHIWIAEREVSERWMNARQRPEFTRPSVDRQWLSVPTPRSSSSHDSVPDARSWELVPRFTVTSARVGARWTDTLDLRAGRGENTETLRGRRFNRIVGDTTIDGRHLWIVRDSAQVECTTRVGDREPGLNSLGVTTRTVKGTIRGRYLYDAEFRVAKVNTDTTTLRGIATLTFANGQTFHSPTRFERTRTVTVYDSAGYKARQASLKASEPPLVVLFTASNEIEERLGRGDTVLRDSLLTVLKNSKDSSTRTFLAGTLHGWGASRAFQERVNRVVLAAGDTNYYLDELTDMFLFSRMTLAQVQFALPFMRDPGLLLAFGRERNSFHDKIGDALLRKPPALIPDRNEWPCTPEACALLAAQWPSAKQPRLRLVGLIAHFTMDPKRWLDTMRVYADSAGFARASLDLIDGVGATWPAASKQRIPLPNSNWNAWLEWANGVDPKYGVPSPDVGSRFRFEPQHGYAVTMQKVLYGRDVTAEWRNGFESPNDTAKFVFGSLLLAMNELHLSAQQIAPMLQNQSNPLGRDLAKRALADVFRDSRTADTEVTAELTDSLLAMLMDSAPAWPNLIEGKTSSLAATRIGTVKATFFLNDKQLPEAVKIRWGSRMKLATHLPPELMRLESPSMEVSVSPIEVVGTLARVTASWTFLEHNVGWAGEITLYLLKTARGWVIVEEESVVT